MSEKLSYDIFGPEPTSKSPQGTASLGYDVFGPEPEQVRLEDVTPVIDVFSTEDPEMLYTAIRQNPDRDYTNEQIDTYLNYVAEKPFRPGKVLSAFSDAFIPAIVDLGEGAPQILGQGYDLATAGTMEEKSQMLKNMAATAAEGAARGAYDLGMIGKIVGLNNSLSKSTSKGGSIKDFGGTSVKYADFSEEEKNNVRRKFRDLQKILADRQAYAEGRETIIGDIPVALSSTPEQVQEALEQADIIAATVPSKAAETYSMFFGAEGAAPYIVGKLGVAPVQKGFTKTFLGATEATADLVAAGGRKIQEKIDRVRKPLPEGVPLKVGVSDSPNAISQMAETVSATARSARKQLDNTSEPNIFMAMSRDVDFVRKNPTLAELTRWLGHGIYNDLGVLSPLANASRPLGRFLVKGAATGTRSAVGGSIVVLPTLDEQLIGDQMAASWGTGATFGGVGAATLHSRKRIDSLADDFLKALPEESQAIVTQRMQSTDNDVRLGKGDLARAQAALNFVRRVTTGTTGDTDVDVVFWDGNNIEAVQQYLSDKGVDQALKLDEISENYGNQFENADADKQLSQVRGFQILNTRRAGAKPILVYNLKTMTGSTIMHEILHGMKRLDLYKGHFDDIESIAFDGTPRGPGEEPTKGLISDEQLFEFYDQMLERADPKTAEEIRKADKNLAANATPGTPQENVGYWMKTRMREEVLADMFESFLYDKEPLYVTRAQLPENASRLRRAFAPVARMMALFMQKTTPDGFLSRQGYRRKGSEEPIVYDSPALEHAFNGLINYQNRLLVDEGKLVRGEVVEEPLGETFKRTQIKKGTALAKSMESSILVKHDTDGKPMYDSEGNIMLEDSQKAIRKKEKERENFFTDTFTAQYYADDPEIKGKSALRYRPDEEVIAGDYIPEAAMEKLRNAPPSLMPPKLLENLEILNAAAKSGRPVEMDYNARLYVNKKGRKTKKAQYSSKLGSSIRLVVPYSFYITKAGNLLSYNLELSHLNSKYNRVMQDPVRSKNITRLWGGDRRAFDQDLIKYIGNTLQPGDPGPTGPGLGVGLDPDPDVARQKANVMSAFLGFTKKDIDFKGNPAEQQSLLDQMNPERQDNLVHSRRLDAVNNVRLTDLERMPLSVAGRKMIQQNYDPGQIDKQYLEAVDQLDDSEAMRLVRMTAEANGYTIPAFHGTRRIDRIGNKFNKGRATSGPMPFFTASREMAESYSRNKSDTSIKEIPSYVDQFKVKVNGREVPIASTYMPYSGGRIADKLSKVSMDEDGNIKLGDGIGGDWSYYMRDNQNNPFRAAADLWLNSGYLYGEEQKFIDVLKAAGVEGEIIWDDPYAERPGVVDAYLRITNPIDVTNMSDADYQYLLRSVKGKRARRKQGGADQWDKNDISGAEFAERLERDREDSRSMAWTSIPDYVTQALIERGYDGVVDTGGKSGGPSHTVYIPFYPSQVKLAHPTRDKRGNIIPLSERFDQSTEDIRFDPGDNTSIKKGFWYNETDDQGAKPTSKKTSQAVRWQQIAQELERRKSSGSDAESVEALVFDGRSYESPWVAPVINRGEAVAKMNAQDEHLLDWSKTNGYYIPAEDFEYAMSQSKDFFSGEEHRVILTPDGKHVIKVTHKDQYGKPFKLASEYLQQMDDYNAVVAPDMQRTFLGVTEFKPGVPAIVSSQPVVTGTKITDEQIGSYMEKEGFTQLGSLYIYQHESGVRVYDLHDGNAVIGEDGKIKPFDVWVDIPRGEELRKRFQPHRTMDDGKVKTYRNEEGYEAIEDEDGTVRIYGPTGNEIDKLFSNIIEAESHLVQAA
tara:strand:+ start:1703 stop:7081 length:5379 start_codon:yes stop_codon:yes gene_type:complete